MTDNPATVGNAGLSGLPAPLVPGDVDLRGFSGFMLNVDRLLASELVALATPSELAAAVLLWARSWKQVPPASLPDDDKILAIFSGSCKNWHKVKEMALRGFVKCNDGRLYHRVLSVEANAAWAKRKSYLEERDADRMRLKAWRDAKRAKRQSETERETGNETPCETVSPPVSPSVRNGSETSKTGTVQGQYRDKVSKKERKLSAADAASDVANGQHTVPDPSADLFRRGKEILGTNAGGLVKKLLDANGGNVPKTRAALELASQKGDAREYIGAIIQGRERDDYQAKRDRGDAW